MNRRTAIKVIGGSAAIFSIITPPTRSTLVGSQEVEYTLARDCINSPSIPPEFLSISLDKILIHDQTFLFGQNEPLMRLLKSILGDSPFLRVGGNTIARTHYMGSGLTPKLLPYGHVWITEKTLARLSECCNTLNAQLIYGLELINSKKRVDSLLKEVTSAHDAFGTRLFAFQLGNEPDQFANLGLRDKSYDSGSFLDEWGTETTALMNAMTKNNARITLAGPDTSLDKLGWLTEFADRFGTQVNLFTVHRYSMGPPWSPEINQENLICNSVRDSDLIRTAKKIAIQHHKPLVITECNSVWGGGKVGVSDRFAAAMWGVEFMLDAAQQGIRALCFHSGNSAHYSPFQQISRGEYTLMPLGYAMRFIRSIIGCRVLRMDAAAQTSVYIVRCKNNDALIVMNKSGTEKEVLIRERPVKSAHVVRLLFLDKSAPCETRYLSSNDTTGYNFAAQVRVKLTLGDGYLSVRQPPFCITQINLAYGA